MERNRLAVLRLDRSTASITTCCRASHRWKRKGLQYESSFAAEHFHWLLFQSGSAGAENIVVSLVTPSAAYMDHFVAVEKGYFREQNLSVEYIRAGGGVATPALLSGDLHLSTSAGSALSAGLRGGPLKIVYTNLSRAELQTHRHQAGDPVAQRSHRKKNRDQFLRRYPASGPIAALKNIASRPIRYCLSPWAGTRPVSPRSNPALSTRRCYCQEMCSRWVNHRAPVLADIGKEIQLIWSGRGDLDRFLAENRGLVERFLTGAIKGREYARRFKEQTLCRSSRRRQIAARGHRARLRRHGVEHDRRRIGDG